MFPGYIDNIWDMGIKSKSLWLHFFHAFNLWSRVELKIERLGRDRLGNLSGLLNCSEGGRKQNEIAFRQVWCLCVCVCFKNICSHVEYLFWITHIVWVKNPNRANTKLHPVFFFPFQSVKMDKPIIGCWHRFNLLKNTQDGRQSQGRSLCTYTEMEILK